MHSSTAGAPSRAFKTVAHLVLALVGSVLVALALPADPASASGTQTWAPPTKETTGVPAGTKLTVHRGDIVVKKAGTVLDGLDIHGFVTIQAPDVTIKNSIVRGGTATYNRGIITNYGYDNLVVQDTDVIPEHPTVYQDGIKGWDFTLRRVYVTGNVDSVKIHGAGNVVIRRSLLENTTYYAHDPNQGGNPTHNDGVQILEGRNIRIVKNTIRGQQNFAVLGAANKGNTAGLVVRRNYLDGGHCTAKFEELNGRQLKASLIENTFGPNRTVRSCVVAVASGVDLYASGNTMSSGSRLTVADSGPSAA